MEGSLLFPAVGFLLAAYSAVANDSIQTLGTFLASENRISWWVAWLWFGGVMLALFGASFILYDGDLAFGLLTKIPEVQTISWLHIAAPATLLLLTYFQIPVSTSILLLGVFSSGGTLGSIILKSVGGWGVGFLAALLVWGVVEQLLPERLNGNIGLWEKLQFGSTTLLWGAWIAQDAANIMVFLPRHMPAPVAAGAAFAIFLLFGCLMRIRGGRIQEIVTEHNRVRDLREATAIDLLYALILIGFKAHSPIPMSTTWLFLGILAGREIVLTALYSGDYSRTVSLLGKNLARAGMGVGIALVFRGFAGVGR